MFSPFSNFNPWHNSVCYDPWASEDSGLPLDEPTEPELDLETPNPRVSSIAQQSFCEYPFRQIGSKCYLFPNEVISFNSETEEIPEKLGYLGAIDMCAKYQSGLMMKPQKGFPLSQTEKDRVKNYFGFDKYWVFDYDQTC